MSHWQKLTEIMGDLFSEDPASLSESSSQDDIEKWDSMGTIDLIAQLEKEFSVSFNLLEVEDLKTIGIIKASLEEKGVDFS
ncbi:MAG: acyl carrier protein [Planctomycetes bacterium]|nr:acyl carrier protein [Planctomycetota bacterium]